MHCHFIDQIKETSFQIKEYLRYFIIKQAKNLSAILNVIVHAFF